MNPSSCASAQRLAALRERAVVRRAVVRLAPLRRAAGRRELVLLARLVVDFRAVDRAVLRLEDPLPGTRFSSCFPRLWTLLRALLMWPSSSLKR